MIELALIAGILAELYIVLRLLRKREALIRHRKLLGEMLGLDVLRESEDLRSGPEPQSVPAGNLLEDLAFFTFGASGALRRALGLGMFTLRELRGRIDAPMSALRRWVSVGLLRGYVRRVREDVVAYSVDCNRILEDFRRVAETLCNQFGCEDSEAAFEDWQEAVDFLRKSLLVVRSLDELRRGSASSYVVSLAEELGIVREGEVSLMGLRRLPKKIVLATEKVIKGIEEGS